MQGSLSKMPPDPSGPPPSGPRVAGTSRPGRDRVVRLLGAVALVASALLIARVPIGPAHPPSGTAGPDAGAGVGIAVGNRAPDFTGSGTGTSLLTDLDGQPVRLADFAGRPLWIVFWATWCTPCQQEAAEIQARYAAHQGDRLAVLAVDVQEPTAAVRRFVAARGLGYDIGLDPTAAVQALYGQTGLPTHVFIDGQGVIRDRYLGQMTGDIMDEHLRSIIAS
jgi:cytochrome c biogenesis protein CcmG, thiol:disulfide interchange protein DsbE